MARQRVRPDNKKRNYKMIAKKGKNSITLVGEWTHAATKKTYASPPTKNDIHQQEIESDSEDILVFFLF